VRRPAQLRSAAMWGALAALAFALLVAFVSFLVLGRGGRLGFANFNVAGLVEGVLFLASYSAALIYARGALRLPAPTLLSFGLLVPRSAGRAAGAVPVVDAGAVQHTLTENRVVIVREQGVPVGVSGLRRDRITSWDELPKVSEQVAVTELRSVLAHEPLVVVLGGGDAVRGVITQEMFLAGL